MKIHSCIFFFFLSSSIFTSPRLKSEVWVLFQCVLHSWGWQRQLRSDCLSSHWCCGNRRKVDLSVQTNVKQSGFEWKMWMSWGPLSYTHIFSGPVGFCSSSSSHLSCSFPEVPSLGLFSPPNTFFTLYTFSSFIDLRIYILLKQNDSMSFQPETWTFSTYTCTVSAFLFLSTLWAINILSHFTFQP